MQNSISSLLFHVEEFIRTDISLIKFFTYFLSMPIDFYDFAFKTIEHDEKYKIKLKHTTIRK